MANDRLDELTDEWISLLKEQGEDVAFQFYFLRIAPIIVPELRKKFFAKEKSREPYYGLVSLLGFTPDTVVLAYQTLQPEHLVVLHTKETNRFLDDVVKYCAVPQAQFHHESFVEDPSADIFRALERALARFPKGARVAIELTGGKKTMAGALAAAASLLDIDLIYIDYSEYMREFRKPKPRSTYIHLVQNPLRTSIDLFGLVNYERAVGFFNVGKFEVAKALLQDVESRVSNPRVPQILSQLTDFYSLWSLLDFSSAYETGERFYRESMTFGLLLLQANIEIDLERIGMHLLTIKELANGDRTAVLLNFFFAAERNSANQQTDIAALLYYRTIEQVFDNALHDASNKFLRDKPDYSLFGVPREQLRDAYSTAYLSVYGDAVGIELPTMIALFDSACLAKALDLPISKDKTLSLKRIAGISQIRNYSVYAHGHTPISNKDLTAIKTLAESSVEAYLRATNRSSLESFRPRFEFARLQLANQR